VPALPLLIVELLPIKVSVALPLTLTAFNMLLEALKASVPAVTVAVASDVPGKLGSLPLSVRVPAPSLFTEQAALLFWGFNPIA